MAGLPLLNEALSVEVVGFLEWRGMHLGVLVTPWCVNLMALPHRDGTWQPPDEGPGAALAWIHARYLEAILDRLTEEYPRAGIELRHADPLQLLVSVILSAQCTDARVNMVTPALFEQFPTPRDFAEAPIPAIEDAIRSTGFFKNKAKAIQGASRALIAEHDGDLPRRREPAPPWPQRLAGQPREREHQEAVA